MLAIELTDTKTSQHLKVNSGAFAEGDVIPPEFSGSAGGGSFPLAWSEGPIGTRSYALLVEDPDAKSSPGPYVHWLVWNIPARTTHLAPSVPAEPQLEDPPGASQGTASGGNVGYEGPSPPSGDPAHHYHVEVFALDRMLELRDGAGREELVAAIAGHVLASGELVGIFEQDGALA